MAYRPHEKQRLAHVDNHRRKLLFWGRQVGKTMWGMNHAWMEAVRIQGRYFIVFKTYKQAKEVVWKQYLQEIPPELRAKTNDTELSITFPYIRGKIRLPGHDWMEIEHDPSQPPSSIQLLGSDEADSHRGMKAHGIIFDEYSKQNPDNWAAVYEPMFSTTNGWAVFMSTPLGYNHWYDMVEYAKTNPKVWYYSEATWRDNPSVTEDFIIGAKKEAEAKGELNTFLQEYELEFRSVEGSVYPTFDRHIHVVDPLDIPREGTIYVGIDFGWDAPTAVVFMRVDYEGKWWVFDEIYVRQTTIADLIPIIRHKLGDERITLMVGDSAQAEHIAVLQGAGFPIIPVKKIQDSIPLGINLVAEKLKPRIMLAGLPRPMLFIGQNCKDLIRELEQYRYPEKKDNRNFSELPVDEDNHGPDALRYIALQLKYGSPTRQRPYPKLKLNSFGLPV